MFLQELHRDLHTRSRSAASQAITKTRAEALEAVTAWAQAAIVPVNLDVATVFARQQQLEYESKRLIQSVEVLRKQNASWFKLIDTFQEAFKVSDQYSYYIILFIQNIYQSCCT